jgi:hypothetical protein
MTSNPLKNLQSALSLRVFQPETSVPTRNAIFSTLPEFSN